MTMNQIRTLLTVTIVILLFRTKTSSAKSISNYNACKIIKKTLTECYDDGDSLIFMQNSKQLGNVVTFYRTIKEKSLRIQCHSQSLLGIDLSKLPVVNFEEVRTIELQKCSLSDDSVLTKIKKHFHIRSLQKLIIILTREKNVTVLSHLHFNGFEEIETLEITTSDSIRFEKNVFKHLLHLKTLKLLVYDIVILPFNIFKPLEKLENLEVANSGRMKNETRTLNFTLNSCINLKHFHLSGVRWPIHVLNLLTYNRPLTTVKIVSNSIKSLSENVFLGSSELEEIYLGKNNIQSLPAAIFSSQYNLVKLDLNSNQISMLDDDIFSKNTDLESLDLSNNTLNFTNR